MKQKTLDVVLADIAAENGFTVHAAELAFERAKKVWCYRKPSGDVFSTEGVQFSLYKSAPASLAVFFIGSPLPVNELKKVGIAGNAGVYNLANYQHDHRRAAASDVLPANIALSDGSLRQETELRLREEIRSVLLNSDLWKRMAKAWQAARRARHD